MLARLNPGRVLCARLGALPLLLACTLALPACSELRERSLGSDEVSVLLDAGLAPAPCSLSDAMIAMMVEEQISHLSESVCAASPLDRWCPLRICYGYLDKNCGQACLLYVLRSIDLKVTDYLAGDGGVSRVPFPP